MTDTNRVGLFRFCPACGREAVEPGDYSLTGARSPDPPEQWDEYRCTGCNRPWTACPCEADETWKALDDLADKVDMVLEADTGRRIAWMMDSLDRALLVLKRKPYGWASAFAGRGWDAGAGSAETEKPDTNTQEKS